MIQTLTTTHSPAADPDFLLPQDPDSQYSFPLPSATARLFCPDAGDVWRAAAPALDIDAIALVRGRSNGET
ncbi:MAG TPA: hypothetical protein VGS41_07350 [Chthonomonadales bacterium]|nr:hypothetical protein [Chthonomonadales bacterium]